jgi:hypothetical protein
MLLINRTHKRRCRRKHLVDKDKDRLLRREFNALANDIAKLSNGQVGGDKILLLVDGRNV